MQASDISCLQSPTTARAFVLSNSNPLKLKTTLSRSMKRNLSSTTMARRKLSAPATAPGMFLSAIPTVNFAARRSRTLATITFNYADDGIASITQTWMANAKAFQKTWTVGDQSAGASLPLNYSRAPGFKSFKKVPANALVRHYTAEMEASDRTLAQIFGGPNALAAGNGFEPAGLAASYPLYRGDIIGDDGKLRRGHLSYAVHLYGNSSGTGNSPLYIPAGFTLRSTEPSP